MRAAILTLTCLLSHWGVFPQNTSALSSTFYFQHFLDGLSNSNASCFAQDPYGYMWIGTVGGLNRFDGRDIKVFLQDMEDPKALPDNRINDLFIDEEGDLWIATFEYVARYDYRTEDFTRFPKRDSTEYPDIDAMAFAEDDRGRLWVGTLHGVYLVDRAAGDVVRWNRGDFRDFGSAESKTF